MKLTNNLGLTEPIVSAIENDPYDNQGTLSITTLLKPPQAYGLTLKHREVMEEDAADRIWALVGQVGHVILERAAGVMDPNVWTSERRYYGELAGRTISGQADLVHTEGVVYDFKFTSGWAVIDARAGKSEWRIQLSALSWVSSSKVGSSSTLQRKSRSSLNATLFMVFNTSRQMSPSWWLPEPRIKLSLWVR